MQISSWQRPCYHNLVDLFIGDRIDSLKLSRIVTNMHLISSLYDIVSNFFSAGFIHIGREHYLTITAKVVR